MIKLFMKGETNFNHNKYILSECISCTITEDLTGIFDLDLEYPLQDTKNLSQYLVRSNIIKCPVYDDREDQLFRIRKATINTKDKKVTVYAQAIARCDLMQDIVISSNPPVVPAGKTRKQAIALVLANSLDSKNTYSVGNLDTSTNTTVNLGLEDSTGNIINYIDVAYVSPLEGILANGDSDKSIYNAYGGEIRYDNFTIDMIDERGADYAFTIKSGKNLQEFEQEIDDTSDNFATALIMKSSDDIYLPNNEIIYSPNIDILGKKYKVITCSDVTAADDTTEALNIVYDQLRERGNKQFTQISNVDALSISNTINFTQLKKTEEYKNYSILEKCELGNNVTIIYEKLNNYTVTARITEIKYNPLALQGKGKITEAQIGNRKKANIVSTINSTSATLSTATSDINSTTATVKSNKTNTDKSINNLTVIMQQNDDSILLEVKNNKTDTDSKIEVLDGKIDLCVKTDDYNSEIDILNGEIESKVEKNQFGSYITQNYDKIIEAIIDATGTHTCTFDGTGLSIQNGGLKVLDSSGNTIEAFTTSGACVVKDLDMRNGIGIQKGSAFYNTLANMEEVSLLSLKAADAVIPSDTYISGFNGTLAEYIKHVMGV